MANEEHVKRLKRGVKVWNAWREAHPDIRPNLAGTSLRGTNLAGVNLRWANLHECDLSETVLIEADFDHATLEYADFSRANLAKANFYYTNVVYSRGLHANLEEARLMMVNFEGASLDDANLTSADLLRVNFSSATLNGAMLNEATNGMTIFADLDLRTVQGLDTIRHTAPSTVGIDTLYKSHGDIPEVFLRGCGVPNSMIEYARALVAAERPIDYYSCFICYSSHDEELAERLYADLQAQGVRCWYAPHDMQIGEPILSGIDRGIRLHDKLLLILSESSVESGWVEQEVLMALAREKTERRRVLFPIRINDAVIESRQGWPAVLHNTIHIGDFRQWKEHDSYQAAFARLLRDLKAEQAA